VVRTSGDPAALLDTVRREIHSVDSHIAATDLENDAAIHDPPSFPSTNDRCPCSGYPDSWR